MNILWFKKDLRVSNNEALNNAINNGPFIPLYIFEPELYQQQDYTFRHVQFLKECLHELQKNLQLLSLKLIIKIGTTISILNAINKKTPINMIFSHQETGNYWTFTRDLAIQKWCKTHTINWVESNQFGVIRKLNNRDGWSTKWHDFITKSIPNKKNLIIKNNINLKSKNIDEFDHFFKSSHQKEIQKGGSHEANTLLKSFINNRGEYYHKEISSPVTAFKSCSRLSPHLSFGTIALRTIYQEITAKKQLTKSLLKNNQGKWNGALSAILGRLRWHCHFIQKLEDEPRIETENLHPAYNLIDKPINYEYFDAWKEGKTGFPMVDACMRALAKTGWLNFRMRAMVTSFACHHLWLPWKLVSSYLANCFTDYEPGIHYSQIQMQAGTTGINTLRIYNPIKQGIDHDPDCIFIKEWIPELENLDPSLIHMVHESNLYSPNYPKTIVNEKQARDFAKNTLFKLRKTSSFKEMSAKINKKHGSRKKQHS